MADGALPPEVASLSTTLLRSFRTAFNVFDHANEGTLPSSDLPLALRSLSLNPSDKELRALNDELVRGSSAIPFVLFCQIAARLHSSVRTPPAMARLFAQFDPNNTGTITQAAMREIFSKLTPTPMTPPETLDALIAYAGACSGRSSANLVHRRRNPLSHSTHTRTLHRPWGNWHHQVRRLL